MAPLEIAFCTMQNVFRWSRYAYAQQQVLRIGPSEALSSRCILYNAYKQQQQRCLAHYGGDNRRQNDKDPTLGEVGSELVSKVK